MTDKNIAITMATLESRLHEVNAIKSGIKLYRAGKAEYCYQDDGCHYFHVEDKHAAQNVVLSFTRDGCDLERHFCNCRIGCGGKCLCKHIVAAILAMQGGIIESPIILGKAASISTIVADFNTAKAVGSGSLDVFATPMMIALMEQAACACLADGLEPGQTSVGTQIKISHTAASPVGAKVTAIATIEYVFGHKVEFKVTATDSEKEIGNGTHTRIIVDAERFMTKVKEGRP